MLRARRLPSLQSPLPGWRTISPAAAVLASATTATALAPIRHFSFTSSLRYTESEDDHAAQHPTAIQKTRGEGGRQADHAQRASNGSGSRARAFRKISKKNHDSLTATEVRAVRKELIEQDRAANTDEGIFLPGQEPAGRTDDILAAYLPRTSFLTQDAKPAVPGGWLHGVSGQLGVYRAASDSNRTNADSVIPRSSKEDVRLDSRANTPTQTSSKTNSTLANNGRNLARKTALAMAQQAKLQATGRAPLSPRRNYDQEGHTTPDASPTDIQKSQHDFPGGLTSRGGFVVGKGTSPLSRSIAGPKPEGPRFRVVTTSKPYNIEKAHITEMESQPKELKQSPVDINSPGKSHPPVSSSSLPKKASTSDESVKPKLSIFERLFNEKKGIPNLRLDAPPPAMGLEDDSLTDAAQWVDVDTPIKPRTFDNSIYQRLFPDEAQAEPERFERSRAAPQDERKVPSDASSASSSVAIQNEIHGWIPEANSEDTNARELEEQSQTPTVVVISAVSSALAESDFYRISPEGKHVEGWAGGLAKVAQARDPLSHEPVGQYFLMFHSRSSAVAYAEEVKRLHALSQRLLHAPKSSGRRIARGRLDHAPALPQAPLTEDEKLAARAFTLCAPDADLRISARTWASGMEGQIASKTGIADVVQALRPGAEAPAKVLLAIGGHHGSLTPLELWLILRDDGRERGTPWVLKNAREGVMPVQMRSVTDFETGHVVLRAEAVPLTPPPGIDAEREGMLAEIGSDHGESLPVREAPVEVDGRERFNRFVVSFTQPVDARRFVRSWHKRAIWDAELGNSVVIDAVALV